MEEKIKCIDCGMESTTFEIEYDIYQCSHCGRYICSKCVIKDDDIDDYHICRECAEKRIETDFYEIEIDETEEWDEELRNENNIKAITTVYLFDKNVHTYCCCSVYSYWMIPLYNNVVMNDGATEQELEHAYNEIDDCFEYNADPNYYDHYDIDAKLEQFKKRNEVSGKLEDFGDFRQLKDCNFKHFPLQSGGIGEGGQVDFKEQEKYDKKLEKVLENCHGTHYL